MYNDWKKLEENKLKKCIITQGAIYKAREAQPGRAELWRCLGCKFKSYLEQSIYKNKRKGKKKKLLICIVIQFLYFFLC